MTDSFLPRACHKYYFQMSPIQSYVFLYKLAKLRRHVGELSVPNDE